jgi:hypothetical protein
MVCLELGRLEIKSEEQHRSRDRDGFAAIALRQI